MMYFIVPGFNFQYCTHTQKLRYRSFALLNIFISLKSSVPVTSDKHHCMGDNAQVGKRRASDAELYSRVSHWPSLLSQFGFNSLPSFTVQFWYVNV